MEPNQDEEIGDNSISKLLNSYQINLITFINKDDSVKKMDNDNPKNKDIDEKKEAFDHKHIPHLIIRPPYHIRKKMKEAMKFDTNNYRAYRDAQVFQPASFKVLYPDDFEIPTRDERTVVINSQTKIQEVKTPEVSCSQEPTREERTEDINTQTKIQEVKTPEVFCSQEPTREERTEVINTQTKIQEVKTPELSCSQEPTREERTEVINTQTKIQEVKTPEVSCSQEPTKEERIEVINTQTKIQEDKTPEVSCSQEPTREERTKGINTQTKIQEVKTPEVSCSQEPTEERTEDINTQTKIQEVKTPEVSSSLETTLQIAQEFLRNYDLGNVLKSIPYLKTNLIQIITQGEGEDAFYKIEDNKKAVMVMMMMKKAPMQKYAQLGLSRSAASTESTPSPSTSTKNTPDSNNSSQSSPQANEINEQSRCPKLKNDRPLRLEATTYELEKFSKNAMIIINQENLDGYDEPRLRTEDDVKALTSTFENFGFEVKDHKDKTIVEVFSILKEFSERDFTEYGCIAVAILTHGTNNGLLRAKDEGQMYSELTVLNYFKVSNNPTLLTKPIILIIQACRGGGNSEGYQTNTELKIRKDLDGDVEPYYLPLHSDILVLHSSFYGEPSFRRKGSWLIQTLCEKLNELAPEHDLVSIVTEVQYAVAIHKQSVEYSLETNQMEVNKQMPVLTSTLIRKLYLTTSAAENYQRKSEPCRKVDIKKKLMEMKASCTCFLEYFIYLRNCLSHFVDESPAEGQDSTALHLLKEANTINEKNYDISKTKITLIAISHYLENKTRLLSYQKYLYFYKVCKCT